MPQLNPSPWLLIFFTTWLILPLLLTPKLLNVTPLKLPPIMPNPMNTPTWIWPWP